jgi:hypothetical protein
MQDNLKDNGPKDKSHISLNEDWEIIWWTQNLGISAAQLKEVIRKVGNSIVRVKEYLKKK